MTTEAEKGTSKTPRAAGDAHGAEYFPVGCGVV
jgi:hypothetical protein